MARSQSLPKRRALRTSAKKLRENGIPDYYELSQSFLAPRLKRIDGDHQATRDHSFESLNAFANMLRVDRGDLRIGLLEKTGGARSRDRAADIIAINLDNGSCRLMDVIGDSEGEDGVPRAGWSMVPDEHAGIRPIEQWKLPYDAVVVPPVDPPPPTSDFERRLTELEARVDRSLKEFSARFDAFVEKITNGAVTRDDVKALVSEHLGRVRVSADVQRAGPRVRLLGQTINLEHDHGIEVSLTLDGQRVQHTIVPARFMADVEVQTPVQPAPVVPVRQKKKKSRR